jgi:threonine/homoserine/homoserine lactone efflux protein
VLRERKRAFQSQCSTFLLTLTNPMTILSFAAIFAGVGLAMLWLIMGLLFAGFQCFSQLRFFGGLFSLEASACRKGITPRVLMLINRVSGVILAAFGLLLSLSAHLLSLWSHSGECTLEED